MNFASTYFSRYKLLPSFYPDQPDEGLEIVVVIPCYDDEFIFETLRSLDKADPIRSKYEIIVVVNSGEQTPVGIVEKNRQIFEELQKRADGEYYQGFRLLPIWVEGTAKKKAGVGFARKVGMDEAVRRFSAINKPQGLIVSLDADTLVSSTYLRTIDKAFENDQAGCFTFQFRHDFDLEQYSKEVVYACRLYELYLRYYRLALKTFDYPFAVHTIGSCFAVRAETYTKIGGMPVRQGGEDFYFLQKATKMCLVAEIKEQIVYPSPRISERVPFGTGPSVRNIISKGTYFVYNFDLFMRLKAFFELFPVLEHMIPIDQIPAEIRAFIDQDVLEEAIYECRKYSASSKAFLKRMYNKFDAFFIVKFLNSFDANSAFPPVDIHEAIQKLFDYYRVKDVSNIYDATVQLDLCM